MDLTYCVYQDQLYCERHYAEKLKPRCATCDELIFSGSYTRAMARDWHSHHFRCHVSRVTCQPPHVSACQPPHVSACSCWHCDAKLTGQRYVLTDQRPTCLPCYEARAFPPL